MKQHREQRDYDAWFRAEVELALREAEDPNLERSPNEVVVTEMERECAELLKRINQNGR